MAWTFLMHDLKCYLENLYANGVVAFHYSRYLYDKMAMFEIIVKILYTYSKALSYTASRSTDFEDTQFQILPKITLIIIFWD